MRLEHLTPYLMSASLFSSLPETRNSEKEKNQYFYRFMVMVSGAAELALGDGRSAKLTEGSVLYLVPNCPYRILNAYGDFSVINIWFDFSLCGQSSSGTVFQADFDVKKCTDRFEFEDYSILNSAYVFRSENAVKYAEILLGERASSGRTPLFERLCSSILTCILCEACRSFSAEPEDKGKYSEIIQYIRLHHREELTLGRLAKQFAYHENHISRICKIETGMSFKQLVLNYRRESAESLMSETNMSVAELAQYLGFYDTSHLLKALKRRG